MKILKFRVKNYRSITDSGDCYLSEKFTILAGKNESGKTSILEALEDFHEDRKIRDEAIPIDESVPDIGVTFVLNTIELKRILSKRSLKQKSLQKEFTLHKRMVDGDAVYSLEPEFVRGLLPRMSWEAKLAAIKAKVNEYPNMQKFPEYSEEGIEQYANKLKSYRDAKISRIVAGKSVEENILSDEQREEISALLELVEYEVNPSGMEENFVAEFIETLMPYFIMYSADKQFPDSVLLSDLDNNEYVADIEEISSFKREDFLGENSQRCSNRQKRVNQEFGEKFERYWSQDKISLEVDKDGDRLNFWIAEGGSNFKPSQRSKGQQWYLNFFVRFCARVSEDRPNVILIDEPGLYLHPKAQKDLLKVLRENTSSYPVIFSTHSPYLIEASDIESVRLVEKYDKKTEIIGKVHACKSADKETLTPILTAIGLGMNDSIVDFRKNNIVVEGPEDNFYLNAFRLLVGLDDVNFINGGGAGNMGHVGAILEGWGCDVKYLLDNDKGGSDGKKKLVDPRSWGVANDNIIHVVEVADGAITDIFSRDDFKKYVLKNERLKYSIPNSQYIKNEDKVLKASLFYQTVKQDPSNIKLSKDTMNRIKALFRKLGLGR
ncbi:MAG: AAA family ATPase [Candidatus Saccharibacteria bacterium]|nr:AAA family ATPase [Candidatus Saccharibacteria bacterium]